MNETNNRRLTRNAKTLRKNMTPEEKHLWYDFLKLLPFNINRQKVIENYIVDFYCASANIAIEVDGGQHYESSAANEDAIRDTRLRELGIIVLRYSNNDINQRFDDVCEDILKHISKNRRITGR